MRSAFTFNSSINSSLVLARLTPVPVLAPAPEDAMDRALCDPGIFMSYWYGGLYVVIEGWRELGLTDSTVDRLLKSPNVELLKRYRNGIFHFQKQYFDERFTGFMESKDSVPWVRELNLAFGTYFLREAKKRKADSRKENENDSPREKS
jgi:hypothetical protein